MNRRWALAVLIALSCPPAGASLFGNESKDNGQTEAEDNGFNSAAQMFQAQGADHDKVAAIAAFENYVQQYPNSPRVNDAQFMVGEGYLSQALNILKAEDANKRASIDRVMNVGKNPAATKALEEARKAFEQVSGDKKYGMGASAQYRLGEVDYDNKDWERAVEDFKEVEKKYPKAYIVGESLMGIIFADLALEQFSQAEANLFQLGETFPTYLKLPEVLYAQGIVALHKGDYVGAENSLKLVHTAESQYYLGKTYLLSKRAYLAAAAFENLLRDYPKSDLQEEAQFFIGDSFFLAEDYDGAISKYQKFISLYPESPLRVSAMFRVGSSYFQKKDYVEARANFQSVLDRYPKDFFAPLAQYSIAESYLVSNQMREALFAYTKVITQYPEVIKVSPLAHFKLAWTEYQVGDYAQAVQTSENFLSQYPTNALAKDVYLVMGNSLIKLKRHVEAVAAFQRIIDLAPASDIAEQALFSILQDQYNSKAYNSILTSYQYIFRHLPPSKSKWRSLSYLYAAEAYLDMNQIDEAKTIYEMVLKVYPDESAAFYAQDGLAWSYSYKGEDDKALQERQKLKDMLDNATTSFPTLGLNSLGIADSMYNQKNYEDAYQLYLKFVSDSPNAPEAATALHKAGMSLYQQRYYTQAIETWRKLLANYPKAAETTQAAYQIADTLFRAQKYPESIQAYKDIITSYPQSDQLPLATLRIAQAFFNEKDDASAMKQVQDLVGRYPTVPEAGDAMDLLETIFDRSKSLDYKATLRALISANPTGPIAAEAQFRLARRAFEGKDYVTASAEFQNFSVNYTNSPKLSKAQFYLGESYFNAGDYDSAVPAFERLINNFDRSDDTALALFHLGSAYYSLKKYEDAVKYYQRLTEEYPGSEYIKPTLFNMALCYKALGKLDMSQYAYQKYIANVGGADPSAAQALWEIYAIEKERKDYEGGLATLTQICDGAKGEGDACLEATYRMGETDTAMNRPDEALISWEKLRGMKPLGSPFRLQALIKLGELYEKASDWCHAVSAYTDLGRNASDKGIAQSAAARAAALQKDHPGACAGAADSTQSADDSAPPAPKKRGRKKAAAAPTDDQSASNSDAPDVDAPKAPAKKSSLPGVTPDSQGQ